MKKTQDQSTQYIDASRRGFIQRSALVGGVAVSGGAAVTAQAKTELTAVTADADKHAGYQLTDKVKEYYRKARF